MTTRTTTQARPTAQARPRVALVARTTLGLLRLTFGSLGLFAPRVVIRRIEGPDRDASPAAVYAFRMFGIRTILLGRDLLVSDGPRLSKALDEAPLIHGSDTATATLLTVTGRVPRRTGLSLMAVSGLNTALSLIARLARPPGS